MSTTERSITEAFQPFFGNSPTVETLAGMLRRDRIPQTLLFAGPEGIGKATLARRFAAALLGGRERIELDDLSRPENAAIIAEREKLASEKRADDPLLFASHPDFVTFAPEGPLRQISIQQMRALKDRAQYKPNHGPYRVFLIDHIDRANEQAANSLLKTLEEPPEHLILIATAENVYDLLPTIRSRSLIFHMSPLAPEDMSAFMKDRGLRDAERRTVLSGGSPGLAVSVDLESYDKRRLAMLTLLEAGSGAIGFADWSRASESVGAARSDKLDVYLRVLYGLLEDVLVLHTAGRGAPVRNTDIRPRLETIAARVSFDWIRAAIARLDELSELVRRNIQKTIALDALAVHLREAA